MRKEYEGRAKAFYDEQTKNENSPFVIGCKFAGIPQTRRQASKFMNGKGAAYNAYFRGGYAFLIS